MSRLRLRLCCCLPGRFHGRPLRRPLLLPLLLRRAATHLVHTPPIGLALIRAEEHHPTPTAPRPLVQPHLAAPVAPKVEVLPPEVAHDQPEPDVIPRQRQRRLDERVGQASPSRGALVHEPDTVVALGDAEDREDGASEGGGPHAVPRHAPCHVGLLHQRAGNERGGGRERITTHHSRFRSIFKSESSSEVLSFACVHFIE